MVHVAPTAFGGGGLFGGGERYPLELARALAREGDVNCELVTFGSRPGTRTEPGGLTVRVLRPWWRRGGHPAHPVAPSLPRVLRTADIVHVHQLRSTPGRLAAVAARARGQRLVTTDHGLGGGGWAGILPRLPHRYLTVSRYSAEVLAVPLAKTAVVYGGVSDHLLETPSPGAEGRAGVLFVGRLTPHKGVDRLIRALPEGAPLTVAGTGGHDPRLPERDYPNLLRHLARGRDVRFVDRPDDVELGRLYRSSAVFVLPSVHRSCYGGTVAISELLGLAALEAMAAGTPVVASGVGGLPEVVGDGETGYLVRPGDEDQLRDRLQVLLGDPTTAAEMGRRARQRVRERFTWSACATRCAEAYADLGSR